MFDAPDGSNGGMLHSPLVVFRAANYVRAAMRHIRTLLPHELPKYREHLLRLSPEDRRMRFGHPIADDGVHTFVDRLSAGSNRILAHHDPSRQVVGAAQLAIDGRESVELAFSVDATCRGQGIGRDLLNRGLLWARNRGIRHAHVFFLAENKSMRRLARDAGMEIHVEAGECEATLVPPPATPVSVLSELTFEAQAMGDYLQHANRRFAAQPAVVPHAA